MELGQQTSAIPGQMVVGGQQALQPGGSRASCLDDCASFSRFARGKLLSRTLVAHSLPH